jgi:hypothetical protein
MMGYLLPTLAFLAELVMFWLLARRDLRGWMKIAGNRA